MRLLPPEIQTVIDQYISSSFPSGTTIELHTVWQLIRFAIPLLVANPPPSLVLNINLLTNDDYYYFEDGIAIWTSDITVALAKDENLALIVASFAIDPSIIVNDPELETKIINIINEINTLINEGLAGAGFSGTSIPRIR